MNRFVGFFERSPCQKSRWSTGGEYTIDGEMNCQTIVKTLARDISVSISMLQTPSQIQLINVNLLSHVMKIIK